MRRWLPRPLTSVLLFLAWLLLNQSTAPAHLLLGAVAALGLPLLTGYLQPLPDPAPQRPLALLRLLALALVEIVRSCFNVCRLILFTQPGRLRSQFIRVPLDLDEPYGLALLACLINLTPGTVWVEILPGHVLALHVFDLHDEQWWIDTIKGSYERPLIEIFQKRTPP